jgi:hypothetical protein
MHLAAAYKDPPPPPPAAAAMLHIAIACIWPKTADDAVPPRAKKRMTYMIGALGVQLKETLVGGDVTAVGFDFESQGA